jgi:hypothetical protein
MSLDDVDRPMTSAMPAAEGIHRRWVLSKRVVDGRPLLLREDRVVHPSGLASRTRRVTAADAAETTSGTPALT